MLFIDWIASLVSGAGRACEKSRLVRGGVDTRELVIHNVKYLQSFKQWMIYLLIFKIIILI